MHNGHVVIDAPLAFFHRMLAGQQGKLWVDCNPEVMAWLGEADRRDMFCNAFPGERRAPPLAPSAPVAPVMVRVVAPDGITSVSIEGSELTIPADGIIVVSETVATTLRDFGFTPAA